MHVLLRPDIVAAVERVASAHRGRAWTVDGFTDLDDRASHPCGILHGRPFSVFAKLDAPGRSTVELRGLALLRTLGGVGTPAPVGPGVVEVDGGSLLLCEALEPLPRPDWTAIGRTLATLHRCRAAGFGLDTDGFFGPLPQDNRPVPGGRWVDFYAERRLLPLLDMASGSGRLPPSLVDGVVRLVERLPTRCGPEPVPALVHGDAQQNNILSTVAGPVLVDPAPYFGHPEVDLAMLDIFAPVPPSVLDGYRELAPIDAGFAERRELWRVPGYLAVIAVDGGNPFGRRYIGLLADALARYA